MDSGGGYSVDLLFVYVIILFLFRIKLQKSSLMKMMMMRIYAALSREMGRFRTDAAVPRGRHAAQLSRNTGTPGRAISGAEFPLFRYAGDRRPPDTCHGIPAGNEALKDFGERTPPGSMAQENRGAAIRCHVQANVASNASVIRYAPVRASAGNGRERAGRHAGICPSQAA